MVLLGPLDRRTLRKRCVECSRRKIKVSSVVVELVFKLLPHPILTRFSAKADLLANIALKRNGNAYRNLLSQGLMWSLSVSRHIRQALTSLLPLLPIQRLEYAPRSRKTIYRYFQIISFHIFWSEMTLGQLWISAPSFLNPRNRPACTMHRLLWAHLI